MSSIKREIRQFLRRSRAVTKKREYTRAKSLIFLINLFLFPFFLFFDVLVVFTVVVVKASY